MITAIIMRYRKELIIYALLALLTTVSSATPVTISSQDRLTLSLSAGGTPAGVAINGTSLPMLATQGGFSFREVLTSGPNIVINSGFDRGTSKPLNWSFTTTNGNVPVWDKVAHRGPRSVKISVPGTKDNKSGYPVSDLMEAEPLQNYRFSAWVKAQGTGGTNGPVVWVVEFDSNKKWLRQTNIVFSKGTYNWTQKEVTFQTTKNTSWINVYANIWNGYGTFWVDSILLTGPPNILKNPSFERGTGVPLSWSFVTLNGNTPKWDNISHSGRRSIKISVPGTKDNKSGYPKSDLINVKPLQYYTLSAWVKTIGSGGTSMPSIRVVELDANKRWLRQTNIEFSEGTNDWMRKEISLQTHINTNWIYVYANIWNGYGTFWVDDIALSPIFGPITYLNGTLAKSIDGTVTQRAQSDGIDFTFYYKPKDKYIVLQGEIQNLWEDDRAFQIMYNLPINANGWEWGDYIRGSRIINDNTRYENVYTIGSVRTQSTYPFASIDNTMRGLSIATPMDVPRIYRIGYDLNSGYYIQYDFGLSAQTFKIGTGHTNFTFIVYKIDEPEWGFRATAKKYYGIYPKFFEKRVNRDGLWAVSVNFSSIRNVGDFGFMFDESGSSNVVFDNTNGIYSFVYSEPWGWWREFGNNPTQPTYSELIATLNNDSKNSVDLWKGIPVSVTASAVINSAQIDNNGKYYLDKSGFWNQWNGQEHWYQNYPTNPDPDLPLPNKRLINYEYEINREFSRVIDQGKFIDYWKFDDNASWDDLSHSGKHSAKISRINEKDIKSGTWTHDRINVLPNTKYTFSVWIKSKGANGTYLPAIRAMERNINGVLINQHSLFAASPDSNWTLKKTTFTTGISTVYIDVYANIYTSDGSGWFDDVALIKEGSTENLVKNGGFENNKFGSRTFYELNGAYLDSLSSGRKDNLWKAYKWAEIENYNKTHWKYVDIPLVFSYDTLKPTLLQLFSQYEYIDFISDDLHNKNKLVMANVFGGYDKYASMLDITGSEIYDVEPDWQSSYRRTLSYQKPISNLMRRVNQVSPISHGDMEQYIKNEMFYGIFPSIYDASKGIFFFQNSTLYERDRNLFKKYIPIIREISKAGWQPISYANVDNSNIRLERYGSLSNNNLYFTVRNNRSDPQNGVIMIDLTKLGIKTLNVNRVIAYDLLTNITHEMNIQNGKATLNINVNPKDTLAFRVNVLY